MICVVCKKFLRVKKQGVLVEELMPERAEWKPYKLWMADLFECRTCKVQMVGGFGAHPIAEHYQPDYEERKTRLGPVFVAVDDCGPGHAGPQPGNDPRPGRGRLAVPMFDFGIVEVSNRDRLSANLRCGCWLLQVLRFDATDGVLKITNVMSDKFCRGTHGFPVTL